MEYKNLDEKKFEHNEFQNTTTPADKLEQKKLHAVKKLEVHLRQMNEGEVCNELFDEAVDFKVEVNPSDQIHMATSK